MLSHYMPSKKWLKKWLKNSMVNFDHLEYIMANVVSLTDKKLRALRAKQTLYKVADGDGLYIFVSPKGAMTFKSRYRLDGKGNTITLGKYPYLSLKEARLKNEEVRHMVSLGVKPSFSKTQKESITFINLCKKYLDHRSDVSDGYKKDNEGILKNHFYPRIKDKNIEDIEAIHVIECLEIMSKKGLSEAIRKAGSLVDRVFKYAVTMQMTKNNPMRDIDMRILLKPYTKRNYAHIKDEVILKQLLLDIDTYWGAISVKKALALMPYVFVRPANIRMATWDEFDFEKKLWVIPARKMKSDAMHIVPLTKSMISIIKALEGSGSKYVFPSPQSPFRPISENTLNVALKRMGYEGMMTTHGFRHTASTLLNEYSYVHGIGRDMIEVQMAHTIGGVEGVYNKATYLVKRRALMQWWSDFLDGLKA